MQKMQATMAMLALLVHNAASLRLGGAGCAHEAAKGCNITSVVIRSGRGFPVQLEKTGDHAYEATLCEDVPDFRTTVKLAQPLFDAGLDCSVSGVPGGATALEPGASVTLEVMAVAKPRSKGESMTTETKIAVKRLSPSSDSAACKVTRKPSAFEDCGYAPLLEKQRQQAAISSGSAPVAPPPDPKRRL
mmetsp:Transcript_66960/g.131998  ORF Transcript_66960/g.131998 Transcript_66960/m.131998 type:complete len:189 (-) Transcript_66960:68-634(-)